MAIQLINSITPWRLNLSQVCGYDDSDDELPILQGDNIELIFLLTGSSDVEDIVLGYMCCDRVHNLIDLTEESENFGYETLESSGGNTLIKVSLIKPYKWLDCSEFKLFTSQSYVGLVQGGINDCDKYLCQTCDIPVAGLCNEYAYSVGTFVKWNACDICDTLKIENTSYLNGDEDFEYSVSGRIFGRFEKPQFPISRGAQYRKTNGFIEQFGQYKTTEYNLLIDYYGEEMHDKLSSFLNVGEEIKINNTAVIGSEDYEIDWIDRVKKAQATQKFILQQNMANVC